jgi:hypothetical protein
LAEGIHFFTTSYISDEMMALDDDVSIASVIENP